MKSLFLLLVTALLACATAGQSPKAAMSANKDECSIAGMVVKLAGSEPLKSASVQLQSTDDKSRKSTTVTTDGSGQFQLKGIQPGRYRLRVMRNGYVSQEYGQKTFSAPGAVLTLGPGQDMKDLLFRLIPSAIIAGRIENEDGEPLPWAHVSALREIYSEGKRTLMTEETVPTNDHGEYRLFGLRPGRYFVAANYRPGGHPVGTDDESEFEGMDSGREDYVRTYYPGSPDSTKAETITVKAGEEIPSMDFQLRPAAVYRVRGHVYNLIATGAKQPRNRVVVRLAPRNSGLLYNGYRVDQNNIVQPDGTFDLPGVLPGSYILRAEWFDDGKVHQTRQNIEVGNADVEGVQLTIAPGVAVSGHIHWDGNPSLEGEGLAVILRADDDDFAPEGYARAESDGSFTFADVPDGPRRVSVYGQAQDSYIKGVSYGGIDAMEDGFVVRPGSGATLDVTLSSRGARVQGGVADADGLPAVGVWVVLVPDAKHRARLGLYKTARTDQHGQFLLHGIAPGDYKLFSWDEVEDGAWEDPEFLKPFEDKSEKVTVQEGDSNSVSIVTIKTAGTEQQKP
jgi:hypothetical protein